MSALSPDVHVRVRLFGGGTTTVRLALKSGAQLVELLAAAAVGLGAATNEGALYLSAADELCKEHAAIEDVREVRSGDLLSFKPKDGGRQRSRASHPHVTIVADGDNDDDRDSSEAASDGGESDTGSSDVEVTCEKTREQVHAEKMARAQAEGRHQDLTLGDSDDDDAPAQSGGEGGRGRGRGGRGRRGGSGGRGAKGAGKEPTVVARLVSSPVEFAAALGADEQAAAEADPELAAVKARITNMLKRGLHENTPEAEAQTAMKLAERLLRKFNLDQVQLLAESDAQVQASAALAGGTAVVEIVNPKTGKGVNILRWMEEAAVAASENFNCRFFLTRWQDTATTHFTFYGVASGAQMAAVAFASALNRIVAMAAKHALDPAEFERMGGALFSGLASKGAFTKAARESYSLGLAIGLIEGVRAAKRERAELQKRRLEKARAKVSAGQAWHVSDDDGGDDDDDDDDACGDAEGFASGGGGGESGSAGAAESACTPPTVKKDEAAGEKNFSSPRQAAGDGGPAAAATGGKAAAGPKDAAAVLAKLERDEAASHQLIVHTEKVYDEELKKAGIKKLCKGAKRKASAHLGNHFADGKRDAKQIDINQRGIDLKDIKGL